MSFFPRIPEETATSLAVIAKSLETNPDYLSEPECPYSDATKAVLLRLAPIKVTGEEGVDLFEDREDTEVFEDQIKRALSEIKDLGSQLTDVNDKLAYFKAKTGLLEKLIALQERTLNLKELSQFRSVLLEAIDQLCDADTTTAIMKRLQGLLEGK